MVSFRREKYEPRGGPNGGDGGKGGSVILKVNSNLQTLYDFKYKHKFQAPNGEKGGISQRFGHGGADTVISVPRGTQVYDADSDKLIADLTEADTVIEIAKGGMGGKGNEHFKSSTRQTPRFAQPGMPGEERFLKLSLKLIADVGLLGLPNAGKSSLLAALTRAHPKIAAYPFTTLYPNLGVAQLPSKREVILADVPGLIEGAHEGQGLGIRFLKHLERTKLLLHLVDVSGIEHEDPLASYKTVRAELKAFGTKIAKLPQIVVLNKIDLLDKKALAAVQKRFPKTVKTVAISAAAKLGLAELVKILDQKLKH